MRKYDESYTACSLAEALGVLITGDAVLDFLREHPYDIDLRKVDSLWFMDLIAPYLQRSATNSRRSEAA